MRDQLRSPYTAAAVIMGVMVFSAGMLMHRQAQVNRQTQSDRDQRWAGAALARGLEVALASDNLSGARRMLIDAATELGVPSASIVLPGGGVLADTQPGRITIAELPEIWPSGEFALPAWAPAGTTELAVTIEGRGSAKLVIAMPKPQVGEDRRAIVNIAGALSVVGLIGWAVVRRRTIAQLGGLVRVAGGLRDAAVGERSAEALRVHGETTAEAQGFNALVGEIETLTRDVLSLRAAMALRGADGSSGLDLARACDALSVGLVLVDGKGLIRYINGAAAVMLGFKRDEAVDRDVGEIITAPKALEAVRAAACGKARQRTAVDVERIAPGGTDSSKGVLRMLVKSLTRDGVTDALVTIEDVTQQRIADEARSGFVAQVTHELRTPLTNIRLYLETLADGGSEDPATRAQCLNVIGQEAGRLERVVADMLSVAEIEAGSFTLRRDDVRIDELMSEVREDFHAQAASKRIAIELVLPPKISVLQGDRDKIALAVHNLVGNALKYTPEGGRVKVAVEEETAAISIAVTDNGIGIRPEECELIFEKFYRAKDKRIIGVTGSGLGLTLARQVIRMHGGDVTVRSQVDRGSTFTIILPVANASASSATVPTAKAA